MRDHWSEDGTRDPVKAPYGVLLFDAGRRVKKRRWIELAVTSHGFR